MRWFFIGTVGNVSFAKADLDIVDRVVSCNL